jgi:hypothetical protein
VLDTSFNPFRGLGSTVALAIARPQLATVIVYAIVRLIIVEVQAGSASTSSAASTYVGLIVICAIWLLLNVFGLHALFSKSTLQLKMYITANWTVDMALVVMVIIDWSNLAAYTMDVALVHTLALIFYLGSLYCYFNCWGIFGPSDPLRTFLCCSVALIVTALSMVAAWYLEQGPLWYLLSGRS